MILEVGEWNKLDKLCPTFMRDFYVHMYQLKVSAIRLLKEEIVQKLKIIKINTRPLQNCKTI